MTVNTATSTATYTGNGVTVTFPVPFYFLVNSDLQVLQKVGATGGTNTLALGADYVLIGAGVEAGGSLTMTVAPAGGTTPDTLYIARNVAAVQQTAYPSNSPFPAASHETALDRLTMLAQQIITKLSFGLFRDPLGNTYDTAGGQIVNAADATGATGLTTLQQVLSLLNGVIAGTASYIASGLGSITRAVLDKLRERPSVVDYGADPTGVVSSRAAFNYCAAANSSFFIPAGTYRLEDAVNIPAGTTIRTAGRRKVIIRMPSTFNMSALGCFVFTGGEPGPDISGITFIQDQPDSTTPTVYPPAIYAKDTPRFKLESMRFAGTYYAVNMLGNTGGAVLDDIELGSLSIGIDIDGAIDSVKLNRIHHWPFGNATVGTLTANQRVAFSAGYGIRSGRCDDLHVTNSLFFDCPKSLWFFNSVVGTGGYTFGEISGIDFDGGGCINITGEGRLSVTNFTMTGLRSDAWYVKMNGGILLLSNGRIALSGVNAAALGCIEQSGGSLQIGSTVSFTGSSFDKKLIYTSAGTLTVNGTSFSRDAGIAYTQPMIHLAGGQGSVNGCFCADIGAGSGVFLLVSTDVGTVAKENNLRGWTIATPTASALTNTYVDGNLGIGSNHDTFSGYFSGDATTTVKLPNGWTVVRVSAGTYTLTHNLSLATKYDMVPMLVCDLTIDGLNPLVDVAGTTTNVLKIRCEVGATLTDGGVFFTLRRFRS